MRFKEQQDFSLVIFVVIDDLPNYLNYWIIFMFVSLIVVSGLAVVLVSSLLECGARLRSREGFGHDGIN